MGQSEERKMNTLNRSVRISSPLQCGVTQFCGLVCTAAKNKVPPSSLAMKDMPISSFKTLFQLRKMGKYNFIFMTCVVLVLSEINGFYIAHHYSYTKTFLGNI